MYKILGFNKFTSKKGNVCCMLQLSRDFTDKELEAGSCGLRVEDAFLPAELFSIAVPDNVGKSCELYYNRNGFLANVSIYE